jgi:hypothetical protein
VLLPFSGQKNRLGVKKYGTDAGRGDSQARSPEQTNYSKVNTKETMVLERWYIPLIY